MTLFVELVPFYYMFEINLSKQERRCGIVNSIMHGVAVLSCIHLNNVQMHRNNTGGTCVLYTLEHYIETTQVGSLAHCLQCFLSLPKYSYVS